MALGGLCGLIRLDGAPADLDAVSSMARAVPWRSDGGVAVAAVRSAAVASLVPRGAGERPAQAGLASAGSLHAVVDARLIARRELARTIGPELLPEQRAATDAELVLAAYRRWGEGCADRLLGDFAFAIWDGERRELFCARDPVGARPFCYAFSGDAVRFASSPLQVLGGGELSRDLDGYAVLDFLTGNFRDQARTFFASVQNLLPGHWTVFGPTGPRAHRYWNPERASVQDPRDWVASFRDLLLTVVADHFEHAGTEVAIMTSGGLDSSTVAAVAQHLHGAGRLSPHPLAVTYVFERLTTCDEWSYASSLPEQTGIEVQKVRADDLSDLAADTAWDEPVDSPVTVPGELTSRTLRGLRARGCRLVATGFGGDSLFDAARFQVFDHVRRGRVDRAWPWVVGARRRGVSWPKAAAAVLGPPLLTFRGRRRLDRILGRGRYWQAPPWIERPHQRTVEQRLTLQAYPRRFRGFARQRQYEHIVGLAQQGLAIESWVADGARYGIETSFPLLDRRLSEVVLAAPLAVQARPGPGGSKWLLREAVGGVLPDRIRRRTDKGSWSELIEEMLCRRLFVELVGLADSSRLARLGLIDARSLLDSVNRYCLAHRSGRQPSHLLVTFYLLERWLRSGGVDAEACRFEPLREWQCEGMV